jgi:hypothetical protein
MITSSTPYETLPVILRHLTVLVVMNPTRQQREPRESLPLLPVPVSSAPSLLASCFFTVALHDRCSVAVGVPVPVGVIIEGSVR